MIEGLASARGVLRDAVAFFNPPTREGVDEYTLAHRWVPRRTGSGYERWTHDEAPYLVAPMRDLGSYRYLTTCIVGPAQSGKTVIAENALLHAVGKRPRNFLWYMQTDDVLESYVKDRINPMIDAHEEMRSRLGGTKEDNAIHFKRFAGMRAQFLSATHANLISKSAPFIVLDEIDAYDKALGDAKGLADRRRQFFGYLSMMLTVSHPDRATGLDPDKHWRDGIMRIYADSTRCIWYWRCPLCDLASSPAPPGRWVMSVEYPHDGTLDEIERQAHLKCPHCQGKIWDHQRRAMNLTGVWVGAGQTIDKDGTVAGDLIRSDTAGYWVVGPMSPFLLKGIGGLARDRANAELDLEVGGDETSLKGVLVKQWGIPFESKGPLGTVDAGTLAERAQSEAQPLGIVSEGVRFLTCWIDIQIAHFEVLVRGWGVEKENWVVDKYRVPADTSTDGPAWYKLLTELIARRYPLATNANRGMAILAIGYDSGGAPGVSDRAYEVWRRLRKENLTHFRGVAAGRDVWTVLPTKGISRTDGPRLSVVYPDNQKKDKKLRKTGDVPLALFNANTFKDDLGGQLMHIEPGPGYVHIPAALRSNEPPHVVFEQLVSEHRDANGRWEKPHQGVRNEMLDLMVGTHVLAHLHGLPKIQWKSPRAWCAEWGKNSMVDQMERPENAGAKAQRPKSIEDLLGGRR